MCGTERQWSQTKEKIEEGDWVTHCQSNAAEMNEEAVHLFQSSPMVGLNTVSSGAGRGVCPTLCTSTEDRLTLYSCP